MKLDIYLNYRGNCGQAICFYEQHLGGKITMMMRHGEQPDQANVQADLIPTLGANPSLETCK
jgi:uncharacterized glyoxalase superfamily protein PhnB